MTLCTELQDWKDVRSRILRWRWQHCCAAHNLAWGQSMPLATSVISRSSWQNGKTFPASRGKLVPVPDTSAVEDRYINLLLSPGRCRSFVSLFFKLHCFIWNSYAYVLFRLKKTKKKTNCTCDILQQNQAQAPNFRNWVFSTSLIRTEFMIWK